MPVPAEILPPALPSARRALPELPPWTTEDRLTSLTVMARTFSAERTLPTSLGARIGWTPELLSQALELGCAPPATSASWRAPRGKGALVLETTGLPLLFAAGM